MVYPMIYMGFNHLYGGLSDFAGPSMPSTVVFDAYPPSNPPDIHLTFPTSGLARHCAWWMPRRPTWHRFGPKNMSKNMARHNGWVLWNHLGYWSVGVVGVVGDAFSKWLFFVAMIRMAIQRSLVETPLVGWSPTIAGVRPFDVGKTAGWGLAESCRAVGVTRGRQFAWWISLSAIRAEVVDGSFLWQCSTDLMGTIYWLVVWNMNFIFPFSWECHHPNWRTHIFQRGRYTTNQSTVVWYIYI
jgi:hypothetical protein